MKKLFVILSAVFLFAACEKNPNDVISAFVEAAQNGDTEAMGKYYKPGAYILKAKYNAIDINGEIVINETPKYLVNSDTLKLSVWKSKIGNNEITWTVEERKGVAPIIAKTSGLFIIDSVKIKQEFGLNSVSIVKDLPDDSIPSFILGIPCAIKTMERFVNSVSNSGARVFGTYEDGEDYSLIKKIFIPSTTEGWDLKLNRPTRRIDPSKEITPEERRYLGKNDNVAYVFTPTANNFMVKVQRQMTNDPSDEMIYDVTSTKGFIDTTDLNIGKNLSKMDDQDIVVGAAKYVKHLGYMSNVIMFKSGGFIKGTTHQTTVKNYSDKQIKYLTYHFVGLNSVKDMVPANGRVMFNIKLIGPISPGNEFRLDVNKSEFWGSRAEFVSAVRIVSYDVEFMDGSIKKNLSPHYLKEFD